MIIIILRIWSIWAAGPPASGWVPVWPPGPRAPVRPGTGSAGSAGAGPAAADWSRWSWASGFFSPFHSDESPGCQPPRASPGLVEWMNIENEIPQQDTRSLSVFQLKSSPVPKSRGRIIWIIVKSNTWIYTLKWLTGIQTNSSTCFYWTCTVKEAVWRVRPCSIGDLLTSISNFELSIYHTHYTRGCARNRRVDGSRPGCSVTKCPCSKTHNR